MMAQEITLNCIVCLYVPMNPQKTPLVASEELAEQIVDAEMTTLTVTNGQMVCLRHVPCADQTYAGTIREGVKFESQGTMTQLSEYQVWHQQETERMQKFIDKLKGRA